ncbi:MAG: MFS transporter [Solirubrobacteraceae bacterium]
MASDTGRRAPAPKAIILSVVCLTQFLVVLDALITTVALPSIQRDLHFSTTSLAWVVNLYALMFGGFLLLGGRASDLFGRKRLFVVGVAVFTVSSLLCGLSDSRAMLLGFRAVQGLGAALMTPASLSILTTTFPEGPERTHALAAWGFVSAAGGSSGLLLGGVLTSALSWPWVFFVNVPVGLGVVLGSLRWIPPHPGPGAHGDFDLGGALTATGGLSLLIYGVVGAESEGWLSARTLGPVAGALVLMVAFAMIERRHRAPLLRLGVFRIRSLSVGNAAMFLYFGGTVSVSYFTTLYLQQVLGYTPLQAGLAFLPSSAAVFAGTVLTRRYLGAVGVKAMLLGSMAISAVGSALMTRIAVSGSYASVVLPMMIVFFSGNGAAMMTLTLLGTLNVGGRDAGLASGLITSSKQIGAAIWLAVLTTLAAAHAAGPGRSALVSGFRLGFWLITALSLASAVVVVGLLRRGDTASVHGPADIPPETSPGMVT